MEMYSNAVVWSVTSSDSHCCVSPADSITFTGSLTEDLTYILGSQTLTVCASPVPTQYWQHRHYVYGCKRDIAECVCICEYVYT